MLAFGDLITNFAGPMNSFDGVLVFIIIAFVQGGVQDTSNRIQVADGGAAQVAGLRK